MAKKGESFSIIRLNATETGWGVVDDASGALAHIDSLAMRFTKERAQLIAAEMNAEAKERGTAAVRVDQPLDPEQSNDPPID